MTDPRLNVVGIGASAGGLDAFHSFFQNMPADSGMAFVVLLHLPIGRRSMLPDILARWTPMRVVEARDGERIEANGVYVPPPHANVALDGDRLRIRIPAESTPREHRPIDGFFDSLAANLRERAIGIVLSGTGSDGSLGLKAIKECGGFTIAQGSNGLGPEHEGMPAGAIATGVVDLIVPVDAMPEHLLRLKSLRATEIDLGETLPEQAEAARLAVCAILRAQVGHDFSGYKDKTFLRRVQRRMQVLNIDEIANYVARLETDHDEVVLLFRDLLIRVTSFFRDSEAFAVLERVVMPKLFAGKRADGKVRVWVPGCATGEEAYSLAILLYEQMSKLRGAPRVQVFATDIDEPAIATARLGRYPATLLEGLSPERRERFFRASSNGYVVTKEIRDLCTFSAHSIVCDPPFSRMDLISCRNLLIYMDTNLQARVIPAFHYSLAPGGILLLGSSESTVRHDDLFEPLDKASRIFQKRNVRSPPLNLSLGSAAGLDSRNPATPPQSTQGPPEVMTQVEGGAGSPFSLANLFSTGRLDRPRRSLVDRTWNDFRAALKRVGSTALTFEQLQQELIKTQEQLQSITEEHQAALEELRSANEELHSVNEELQSTNEELETSREEIQSINEELNTVNAQLSGKVEQLDRSNSDLKNLFDSSNSHFDFCGFAVGSERRVSGKGGRHGGIGGGFAKARVSSKSSQDGKMR
jgi:two-component system, chemotaxis family, CheB/CheR fusion protein